MSEDHELAVPADAATRPLAYTLAQAAALLGVSASRVRTMVEAGTLSRVPGLGRTVRIPSRAVFELVGEPVPPIVALGEPVPVRRPAPVPRPAISEVAQAGRTTPPPRRTRLRLPGRPREPTVEAPIRVRDGRLWLLADPVQYRLVTWHIGEAAALCGKAPARAWKRSMKRYPVATICPTCLTLVSQTEGVDLASVPIETVAMLRQTHRGSTVSVLRAGWHLGDGRVTKCRKRAGPWALTERYPDRRRICFECGERDRWEQEKVPNSLVALGAGSSWSVLLDAAVADETLLSLLRDAPGLFTARRAERAIEGRDGEQYGQGLGACSDRVSLSAKEGRTSTSSPRI